MNSLQNASTFLINSICDLYLLVLLLRLILQYLRVDYYNPLTQFILTATSPVVVRLRRFIPGYMGLDLATICAILTLTLFKLIFIALLNYHQFPALSGLFIWATADILSLSAKLFFYAILINTTLSWLAPAAHSPINAILAHLTNPLLERAKRFIPPLGGFDLTPIAVMIGLQLVMIIFNSVAQMGLSLAI